MHVNASQHRLAAIVEAKVFDTDQNIVRHEYGGYGESGILTESGEAISQVKSPEFPVKYTVSRY
jgi:hypothetical protein